MDPSKKRAIDLMSSHVATVDQNTPLISAAKTMHEHKVSSLIVNPQNENDALGILTRKDIITAMLLSDSIDQTVADHMSKPAICVHPNLSIENCLLLMQSTAVRRLPVMNGTQLVGILSNTDIFEALADEIR